MKLPQVNVPIQPRPIGCPVPLTATQLRVWNDLEERGTRLSDMRLTAASIRIVGPLDVGRLRTSIETVVQRHESLRTRIVVVDGIPRQHVDDGFTSMRMADLSMTRVRSAEDEARRLAQEFVEEDIDLSVGPLFEAKVIRIASSDHVLVLALDHMVCDGISIGIVSRETWLLYDLAIRDRSLALAALPVQFPDYAVWQEETKSAWMKEHAAYWRGRLSGVNQVLSSRGVSETRRGRPHSERVTFQIGSVVSKELREVARRERVLLSSIVLAVYVATISCWYCRKDFVVGFVSHGRRGRPELTGMVGFLAHVLHLRITVDDRDNFLDLLKSINFELATAYQHQDFGHVAGLLPHETAEFHYNWASPQLRSADRMGGAQQAIGGGMRREAFSLPERKYRAETSLKLGLGPFDTADGIVLNILYHADCFDTRPVAKLCDSFRVFAAAFARDPFVRIVSVTPNWPLTI